MKRKKGKYYKEIAFLLFDELSEIYVEDVDRHADLCRRYPKISHKYVKWLERPVRDIKMPDELNFEESREKVWKKLQEKICSENNKEVNYNNNFRQ